jgi:hypothetical protein
VHNVDTAPHDLYGRPPGSSHGDNIATGLFVSTSALDREQSTARCHQWQAPTRQASQRRYRSGGHHVIAAELISNYRILGAPAMNLDGETERCDYLPQPRHPPGHRL